MWLRKLVIFLVRKRLGLKLYQKFKFANQKHSLDYYYFNKTHLIKVRDDIQIWYPSSVSLNHLLSDECKENIIIMEGQT